MEVLPRVNHISQLYGPQHMMEATSGLGLRRMAYPNEQQAMKMSKRRSHTQDTVPRLNHKPTLPPSTLKTVKSTSALPQNKNISPPTLSRIAPSQPRASPTSQSGKALPEKPQEINWQDLDIPPELEMLQVDTAEEIRNIVQESMDEHRALRASRTLQPQAIVVRTTITQSRLSAKPELRPVMIQSSASASTRRAESSLGSSLSGDMSSTRSVGIESTTSVGSSDRDDDFLKPPASYNISRSQSSQDLSCTDSAASANQRRTNDKPLRERGLLRLWSSRKGDAECNPSEDNQSRTSESTNYSEDRRYAIVVGDRYYCPAPGCARWTDLRYARAFLGELRCRQCSSYVSTERRGENENNDQHHRRGSYQDATLPQAERTDQKTMLSKEVSLISALNFPRTVQCLTEEEREAEEQRLAEDARRRTASEYERLGNITEYFEYLRKTLESIRDQQKQAIEQRHRLELQTLEEREAALVGGEQILDRDQQVATERAEILKRHQSRKKAMRKAHGHQLLETFGTHRRDQDACIYRITEEMKTNDDLDQAAVLDTLLKAQEVERKTLRSQQTRESTKLEKRGTQRLESFDTKTEAERLQIVEAQVREATDITLMADTVKDQSHADWQWFNTIFLDRAMMLGEDERKMILSGAHAPELS